MKLSFIISAYEGPEELRLCLQSLCLQSLTDWEAIVMDNAPYETLRADHKLICRMDDHIRYYPSYAYDETRKNCYDSSEFAARRLAHGEWLCFPSDDGYYIPQFASKLVRAGETGLGCDIPTGGSPGPLDLVCCDFVWGRRPEGTEAVWTYCDGGPQVCHIDKGSFIVRSEWFNKIGWPGAHDPENFDNCDGKLSEHLVAQGGRVGRVTEILFVHNP